MSAVGAEEEFLGPLIRHARIKLGLTQVEVGRRVGVDPRAIGQWELGHRTPEWRHLAPLAKALFLDADLLEAAHRPLTRSTRVKTGQRYGRWIVGEIVERRPGRALRYRVTCDCGTVGVASGCNLATGGSTSCGCLRREMLIERNRSGPVRYDLKGQRFGRLTVLSYARKGQWLVLCDCTKKKVVRGEHLRRGLSSCGCIQIEVSAERHAEIRLRPYLGGWRVRWYENGLCRETTRRDLSAARSLAEEIKERTDDVKVINVCGAS